MKGFLMPRRCDDSVNELRKALVTGLNLLKARFILEAVWKECHGDIEHADVPFQYEPNKGVSKRHHGRGVGGAGGCGPSRQVWRSASKA